MTDPDPLANSGRREEESISSFKIKPPVFSETSVTTWFRIVEAQFHLANIRSSRTKYFHVMSQIPPEVLDKISQNDLDDEDYDKFKKSVIGTYEKSKIELFNDFLSKQIYGGKPSVYLQDMVRQAGKLNIDNDIVRMQFLKTLPVQVRTVLAAHTSLTLQQLGELANDILVISPQAPVMAVEMSPTVATVPKKETSQQNFSSSVAPFRPNQRPKVCRGHIYYGPRSRSCKPWCTWPTKTGLNILPNSRPGSRSSSPTPTENQ